jgi:hypothetical protein
MLCPINFVNGNFKPAKPVWIPYERYLADSLPFNIGPSMRAAVHVGSDKYNSFSKISIYFGYSN